MIVVIDTNVLLSAALRDRLPERVVLHIATRDECRWIVSADILAEYIGVLKRPKFGLSESTIESWSALLALRTVTIPPPAAVKDVGRDPKDAPFVAAAIAANADFLVIGDRDLLELHLAMPTRILTVAVFAAEHHIS
jgi:putative PIN family toxin of toxin-antitoxin system